MGFQGCRLLFWDWFLEALRQFRFPYRPETLNPKFETPWPLEEVVESFTKTRSEGDRTLFAMGLGNVVSGTSEAVGFE